jgi:hypothetical protein
VELGEPDEGSSIGGTTSEIPKLTLSIGNLVRVIRTSLLAVIVSYLAFEITL